MKDKEFYKKLEIMQMNNALKREENHSGEGIFPSTELNYNTQYGLKMMPRIIAALMDEKVH